MSTSNNPALYVGTYHKYGSGSIAGAWVDLTKFDNEKDFYAFCVELHKDEEDPEFMFQDYENFPEAFYSESGLDDRLWDYIALDDDEKEKVDAYLEGIDKNAEIKDIIDNYYGSYDDDDDSFAYALVEETGMLSEVPESFRSYFDYKAYQRDLLMDFSHTSHKGQLFVWSY